MVEERAVIVCLKDIHDALQVTCVVCCFKKTFYYPAVSLCDNKSLFYSPASAPMLYLLSARSHWILAEY